jgi:hypothetical protein
MGQGESNLGKASYNGIVMLTDQRLARTCAR